MRFILLVIIISQATCSEKILDVFFRDFIENTTAGYALYGDKPVDLQGFRELEQTMPGTKERKRSVIGLLTANYLERFPTKANNYTIVFHPISTGFEILTINKKSFSQIVKDNALLFSSRFGFECSPEDLLNQLVSNGFEFLFKKETVLQGIVLGYGFENAIAYANGVSVLKECNKKITLPYKSISNRKNLIDKINNHETRDRLNSLVFYTPKNNMDKTKIPFSYLKNSSKSQKLIAKYQKTQLEIENVLRKPHFLQEICNRLGISLSIQFDDQLLSPFEKEDKPILPALMARLIKQTFPKQISPEFIAGMKDAQNGCTIDDSDFQFLDILWKRNPSLTFNSDKWMNDIAESKGVECKIPGYLYISTIKPSTEGEILTPNYDMIKMRYLIQDMSRVPLVGSFDLLDPAGFHLEDLMPGFAHGLIGMHKGEIREIYIHPDFAYGPSCEIGDGNVLIVKVELIDFDSIHNTSRLPLLQPIDVLNLAPKIQSTDDFISILKKYAYVCGVRTWDYYKHAEPLINLNEVVDCLSKENTKGFSKQEKSLLLKLEYQLQFRDCQRTK